MTWLVLSAFYLGGAVGSAAVSLMIGSLDLAFFRYGRAKSPAWTSAVSTTVFALAWPLAIVVGYLGARVFRQDHCDDCGCTISPPCACFVRCGDCGGFHHGEFKHGETADRREYLH